MQSAAPVETAKDAVAHKELGKGLDEQLSTFPHFAQRRRRRLTPNKGCTGKGPGQPRGHFPRNPPTRKPEEPLKQEGSLDSRFACATYVWMKREVEDVDALPLIMRSAKCPDPRARG